MIIKGVELDDQMHNFLAPDRQIAESFELKTKVLTWRILLVLQIIVCACVCVCVREWMVYEVNRNRYM